MYGAWTTKTKAFFAVAALEMFAEEFEADAMIHSLVELCELAITHPDFDTEGNPGWDEYDWADQATDTLSMFFLDEFCVEDDGSHCPRFEFNPKKGTLELTFYHARMRRRKVKRAPPPSAAFDRVPIDLFRRRNSSN